MNLLGSKLSELRREHGFTQDYVAEYLGVSPQAVSKWENNVSCPDVMLLPEIAGLYHTSIDALLSSAPAPIAQIVPMQQRKKVEEMMLRIIVDSNDGDKVRVNLPLLLVKTALEIGLSLPQVTGNRHLENIQLDQIMRLAETGLIGNLIEVESADGDTVRIVVE